MIACLRKSRYFLSVGSFLPSCGYHESNSGKFLYSLSHLVSPSMSEHGIMMLFIGEKNIYIHKFDDWNESLDKTEFCHWELVNSK